MRRVIIVSIILCYRFLVSLRSLEMTAKPILLKLVAESLERVELDLITNLLHESNLDVKTIYILVKIKDMRFYGPVI